MGSTEGGHLTQIQAGGDSFLEACLSSDLKERRREAQAGPGRAKGGQYTRQTEIWHAQSPEVRECSPGGTQEAYSDWSIEFKGLGKVQIQRGP